MLLSKFYKLGCKFFCDFPEFCLKSGHGIFVLVGHVAAISVVTGIIEHFESEVRTEDLSFTRKIEHYHEIFQFEDEWFDNFSVDLLQVPMHESSVLDLIDNDIIQAIVV